MKIKRFFFLIALVVTMLMSSLVTHAISGNREVENAPYTEGGVSDKFIAYPLDHLDEPIPTRIVEISTSQNNLNRWYCIDGRFVGTTKPNVPGLYINGNKKVLVTQ